MRRFAAVLIMLAFPLMTAPEAAPQTSAPPASAPRLQFAISDLLELHTWLQAKAKPGAEPSPEYGSAVEAYRRARALAPSGVVWQTMRDACVEGPDVAAVNRRMTGLPASLPENDREAARVLAAAFSSAWQHYEAHDKAEHTRSLQSVLARVLRKHFAAGIEPRVMGVLYEKMGLVPLDAAITVYPVIEMIDEGAFGKTSSGYYVAVAAARRENLVLIESLLHQVTHLLEENQPASQRTLIRQVRARAAGAGEALIDDYLHGFMVWNASELLTRLTSGKHRPLVDISTSLRVTISRWVRTYEAAMSPWLDGRSGIDAVVTALAAALRPPPPATRT